MNDQDIERRRAPAQPGEEHRVAALAARGRREAAGGWGLVLVDLVEAPRSVPLVDGVVLGTATREAKVEGPGVAPEHARVVVRADGCYLEDLGSPEGTFVGGVRARRIGVLHGDVVRLGRQLAVFVERDLSSYGGAVGRVGTMYAGAKQRRDWIDPTLEMARTGSSVCIEGGPGLGKRSLALLAAAVREGAGEIVRLEGRADPPVPPPSGVRPMTWVVVDADRIPRPQQLEVAHAAGRSVGVSVIATVNQPLDRATADGLVAPWFASLFSSRRVPIPPLEMRREDIPHIVRDCAERQKVPLERISPEFLEALMRAGWPGGVPQLEAAIGDAAIAAPSGPLPVAALHRSLTRSPSLRPSLPPGTDPSLARARLEDALARANGSVASAARSLGMSRQAIYREAERLGLDISRRKLGRG